MSNSNGLNHHQDGSDEDDEAVDSSGRDVYYQFIAPSSDADDEDDSDDKASVSSNNASEVSSRVADRIRTNGFFYHHAEDVFSALNLNEGVAGPNVIAVEEEEDETERAREQDASIVRAFKEDASRRSVPLTPENASRVVEAMRGVVFHGAPPDWADRVPEEQWVDRLRSLRDGTGTLD